MWDLVQQTWSRPVTCQSSERTNSRGLFVSDNPLTFSNPAFIMQIAVSSFCTTTMYQLLKPFGHSSFFSNMLGAIITVPSCLGFITKYQEHVFPEESLYVFETLQYLGVLFYVFLVGLKMDIGIAKRIGKRNLIIGLLHFFVPLAFTLPTAYIIDAYATHKPDIGRMLIYIAWTESSSTFYVIVNVLSDLKLLNSELGRIAMCSSVVSTALSFGTNRLAVTVSLEKSNYSTIGMLASLLGVLILIVFLVRPLMFWIIRKTPEGHGIRETHMAIILIILLITALSGEVLGQNFLYGPMFLGLVIPPGPPLASNIEERLHVFYSGILLPLHLVSCAGRAHASDIDPTNLIFYGPIILLGYFGKLIATMLTLLYFKKPFNDALSLGLIMCSQGVMDIQYMRRAHRIGIINSEVYAILLFTSVITAGIIAPIAKVMYNPSRRYLDYHRGSLKQAKYNSELRILACVYGETNTTSIIHLVEASNPTRDNPISLNLLHLTELRGRATPLLVAHKQNEDSIYYNRSHHIINAFESYEQSKLGMLSLECFTCMSPFETMHEDICTIAIERSTSLIMLPFHRQQNSDGLVENDPHMRNVNLNVLKLAPCSLGILIDLGKSSASNLMVGSRYLFRVAVIFMGGPDDREALTYGMRIAEHPNVNLNVIHILASDDIAYTSVEKKLDRIALDQMLTELKQKSRIGFREAMVSDGAATVKVLMSLKDCCDLIIVGRYHSTNSPLLIGLSDWGETEFPELGCLGDLLATSELATEMFVLVVQKQPHEFDNLHPMYSSILDV